MKDEPSSSAADLGYGETRSRAATSLGVMLKTDALAVATPGDTPEFVDMLSAHGMKTDEKSKIATRYEASLRDVDPAVTSAVQVKSQRVSPPVRHHATAKSSGGHHHHASHSHGKSRPANLNLGASGSGVGRSHLQPPQAVAAAGTYLHAGLPLYLSTPAIADHHRCVFVDLICMQKEATFSDFSCT